MSRPDTCPVRNRWRRAHPQSGWRNMRPLDWRFEMCAVRRVCVLLICLYMINGCGENPLSSTTPEVDAGNNQFLMVASGDSVSVTLDGTNFSNLDGAVSHTWRWTDANGAHTVTGDMVSLMLPPGTYAFTLTVSDEENTATNTIIINIASRDRVLVDASHDGGVWWSRQGPNPDAPHQGKALADHLRSLGFEVDELPGGTQITDELLGQYGGIIRAGNFGSYRDFELEAYERFIDRGRSLILISEFLRPGVRDELADLLGIPFVGVARGFISQFGTHPVTQGMTPLLYNAGSVILSPADHPNIEVLGRLRNSVFVDLDGDGGQDQNEPTGAAVMGILRHPSARIFSLGDIKGIEGVPQPFVDNLVSWVFGDN